MTKYKSKTGFGILLFISTILGSVSALMIYLKLWIGLLLILSLIGFIAYIFTSTYYIIHEGDLVIRGGFVTNLTISIDKIKKIADSNNLMSSPANSIDRIEIKFNKSDSILISPKNKSQFIEHLKSINPNIEVKTKQDD